MGRRHHRLLLWCAATDSTFRYREGRSGPFFVGKCIHCQRKVIVDVMPGPGGHATLEHIRPRTHGGTNAQLNLAVACGGCNASKGYRLDVRQWTDPKLQSVVRQLRARRLERLRPPLPGVSLPALTEEEARIWASEDAV